jgi:hypothetical protein
MRLVRFVYCISSIKFKLNWKPLHVNLMCNKQTVLSYIFFTVSIESLMDLHAILLLNNIYLTDHCGDFYILTDGHTLFECPDLIEAYLGNFWVFFSQPSFLIQIYFFIKFEFGPLQNLSFFRYSFQFLKNGSFFNSWFHSPNEKF